MTSNTDPQGVEGACAFMTGAAIMLERGEMPAPGTLYAARWAEAHRTILASHENLRAELERVREAAQAAVDRWDSPPWKEVEPISHVINGLRTALNREG